MVYQKVQGETEQRTVFQRYHKEILQELRRAFTYIASPAQMNGDDTLIRLYGQMQYHLGWLDQQLLPTNGRPGKLLRPKLLLLSYELAWAQEQPSSTHSSELRLQPALPTAAAVELAHNFTLLHDDIEDGDVERRHRPTVWSIWGIPQAILVGDAMLALTRLHLWRVLDEGVEFATALDLAKLLDAALLKLTEGQHLDISFEQRPQVSLSSYEAMISRKTAQLMQCAIEMGATLGTRNREVIEGLARVGHALGLAFQVRDDMLGIWASEAESGKLPAGDIYQRKKSLPILHALECAQPADQQALVKIYSQAAPVTQEQVQEVLTIFAYTQTREYCNQVLAHWCQQAYLALDQIKTPNALAARARNDLEAIIDFVRER